jgi:hypothetical protein
MSTAMKRRAVLGVSTLVLVVGLGLALRPGRELPAGFISLKATPEYQSPALLERAWALPEAATFPRPIVSQSNPSACGPTSAADVLRSLGQASTPGEVASRGSGCLGGVCFGGLTLEQLANATRQVLPPGWAVSPLHPATVEALRDELRHANDPGRRYIVNFHRFPLFGTGGGHHSPIGGLLEPEDLVFVLDVNASYQPWLVPTARLFEAMDTVDSSSGQKRGLLRLERSAP